jgi:3-dehydroquinate synthase
MEGSRVIPRTVRIDDIATTLPPGTIIISDGNVWEKWSHLFAEFQAMTVPPGEASKSWSQAGILLEELIGRGLKRDGSLAAVGGGVVGDLAGFVAAVYMRGVRLYQVPTSLLAMVDSAIGGKVGVDLPQGKNLAGAFHFPEATLVCPEFLETLPHREWLCGSAEVWKYGAIMDEGLFEDLVANPISGRRQGLDQVIRKCAEHKARVVEEDPFEKTGLRAILNFGHTLGHAVENLCYESMSHGECVAIGMAWEASLGEALGVTAPGTHRRLEEGLRVQGLPTSIPRGLDPEVLLKTMGNDKKAGSHGLAFSLLTRIGECKLVKGVEKDKVSELLRASCV